MDFSQIKVGFAATVRSCECKDHCSRGAICKHAGAVLIWWQQLQVPPRLAATVQEATANRKAEAWTDFKSFPWDSFRAYCKWADSTGAVFEPPIPDSAAASCAAAPIPVPVPVPVQRAWAADPFAAMNGAGFRPYADQHVPRYGKPPVVVQSPITPPGRANRARSLERPPSALRPSGPGHSPAVEKRVRVVVADEPQSSREKDLMVLREKATKMRAQEPRPAFSRTVLEPPGRNEVTEGDQDEIVSAAARGFSGPSEPSGLVDAGLGRLLAITDAVRSQELAVEMINAAKLTEQVILLGFGFDRSDLVFALIQCRKRGSQVRVVLDRKMTLTGQTRDQLSSAKELVANGVGVRIVAGVLLAAEYAAVGRSIPGHLVGIHHAKSLLVGRKVLVGSTNWTTSSRSNWEMGVEVEVDAVYVSTVEDMFLAAWRAGTDLELAQIHEAQRARSASAGRGQHRRG